jgi:sulfotransferase 6B1
VVKFDLPARLARRSLRRAAAQRAFPQIPINKMPILFGNSFPKSGTHLLTQILAGLTQLGPVVESGLLPILTFEGESGRPRPLQQMLQELKRLSPGDIAYGHLHAFPEVVAGLCRLGVAPYFIYRDPRDVVVSHVFYVTDLANRHVHHDYYVNQLKDFDDRLKASIMGRPALEYPFPNVRERFEPYLPWLDRKEVLALRFEDLIADPQTCLRRIFDHAISRGFVSAINPLEAVAVLARAINPQSSPTFRKGESGGWREHFNESNKKLFKETCGDLLIRLGYEQNQNW